MFIISSYFNSHFSRFTNFFYNLWIKRLGVKFLLFSIYLISGCSIGGGDINGFQKSTAYLDLLDCIGLDANTTIKKFKSESIKNQDANVFQVNFENRGDKLIFQWIHHNKLNISELVYYGRVGDVETIVDDSSLNNLCGISKTDLSPNLRLNNSPRQNKKYGMALATFGYSPEAKNRTISLSEEFNALQIEKSRPVQLFAKNFAVISTDLVNEVSIYNELKIMNKERDYLVRGMKLNISNVVVINPLEEFSDINLLDRIRLIFN